MAKVKCSKCGALAHVSIKGKAYCLDCAPNPEKMERPKPWPKPPVDKKQPLEMEIVKITGTSLSDFIEKRPWWKRLLGI